VRAVRVVATELADDGRGRLAPRNVPGTETDLRADVVIQAFGFRPSPPAWCAAHGLALHRDGRLVAGDDGRLPFQTTHPRVFAGGDNVRGADLVVRAVHDGREAAVAIAQALQATAVTLDIA
jgi:glutamate synthase (NADPH/NADH) small chain